MSTILWVIVPLVAVGAMYWLSFRIEPHWASKDGQRFITTVQAITGRGEPEGRPKEARIAILSSGRVQLSQRRLLGKALNEQWTVAGKSPTPPTRKVVYVLNAVDDDGSGGQLALKLPADSRAVPLLDEIIARRSDSR